MFHAVSRALVCLLLPACAAVLFAPPSAAQEPGTLDPTRTLPVTVAPAPSALPEQYIWTADDITTHRPDHNKYPWNRPALRIAPHFFRTHFQLAARPAQATLYLAGPREAHVYLNGHLLADFASDIDTPIASHVFHADATPWLRQGSNTLAIAAIRGRGVVSATGGTATQQLAYGEVLVVRIAPGPAGTEAAPLLISDQAWRSSALQSDGWQQPAFNDSAWPHVASLGPIESNPDFFQWSVDAGMYAWPGYRGLSPTLRIYPLAPVAITHIYAGQGRLDHLDALTAPAPQSPFSVTLPPGLTDGESPAILLDFGREVAGRILVESASATTATLSIAYGESELEALSTGLTPDQRGGNYLGTNLLEVPANGTARGPKSAFRFVRIRFLRGAPTATFRAIRLEGIYTPVAFDGSFTSSDPLLNRIWEVSAWTVHLAMQDDVWDAPKRDRGRWAGDLDIESRGILAAFGDRTALETTLARIGDATPADAYVNGIPSYSPLWITTLRTLYQHTADLHFLTTQHATLLKILARMDKDIGPDHQVSSSLKGWSFVDWAPDLYGYTPETRIGTDLQLLRGFRAGAELLDALNDPQAAARYRTRAEAMTAVAEGYRDSAKRTFGATWQLNALAVLNGLESALGSSAPSPVWSDVLAHVQQSAPSDQVISPYFSAYVLDAMSELGHPEAALAWIRTYWGGMLAEGATSFWESYDLRWPKNPYHLSLQADGTSGFFVSLAHGWSAGPAAWLAENVLGITPLTPGYTEVSIDPHLLGLMYAKGAVPTPHGPIAISVDAHGVTLDLPPGTRTTRLTTPAPQVLLDGAPATPVNGVILIRGAGHHVILTR